MKKTIAASQAEARVRAAVDADRSLIEAVRESRAGGLTWQDIDHLIGPVSTS